jgi:Mg2+/citrate symporter
VRNEVIDKFTILVTSAFGLIAALAWNEAIQDFMKTFGLEEYGPLVYAIIVTVLAVVITILLGWIANKARKKVVKKTRAKKSAKKTR